MHRIDLYTRKYGTLGIKKENWGVTTHFSEIMKLQFGKERHTYSSVGAVQGSSGVNGNFHEELNY